MCNQHGTQVPLPPNNKMIEMSKSGISSEIDEEPFFSPLVGYHHEMDQFCAS